jgi:hypothetical protein
MLSFQPSAQDVDGARAALVLIMAGVAIFWHLVPRFCSRSSSSRDAAGRLSAIRPEICSIDMTFSNAND